MDIYDPPYVGRIFLFVMCGILDASWQVTSYWIMGAMSNDPAKLAYFAGLCKFPHIIYRVHNNADSILDKSIQSAGAAGVWRADAVKLPFVLFIPDSCPQTDIFCQVHEYIPFYLGFACRWSCLRSANDSLACH